MSGRWLLQMFFSFLLNCFLSPVFTATLAAVFIYLDESPFPPMLAGDGTATLLVFSSISDHITQGPNAATPIQYALCDAEYHHGYHWH